MDDDEMLREAAELYLKSINELIELQKGFPTSIERGSGSRPPSERIFPLSARNGDQLREAAVRLRDSIQGELTGGCNAPRLRVEEIEKTLRTGRISFDFRLVVLAESLEELAEKLSAYLDGKPDEDVLSGHVKNSDVIMRLFIRKEKEEFLHLLSQSGDARKLAQLWIDGILPDC